MHVNPGGQLPRQRGYSPPHASNGVVVVVVVCTRVVVVVDLDVVLVAGRVVVVCVVVGRAVVVVRGTVTVVVVRVVVVVVVVVVGGRVVAVVVVERLVVVVDVGVVVVGGRVVAVLVVVERIVVVVVDVDVVVGGVVVLVVVDPVVDWKVASTMTQLEAEPKVRFPSCGPAALDRMSSRSEEALPFWTSRRYGTIWLVPGMAEAGWPPVRTAATTSSPPGTGAVGPTLAKHPTPCDTMARSSAPTVATCR